MKSVQCSAVFLFRLSFHEKDFFLRAGRSQRSPSLHAGLLGAETIQVLAIKGALPPL